jgi:hypothetical protein
MRWLSPAISTEGFTALFKLEKPVQELPFIEAAELAAKQIAEKYSDLKLCLSGGVDSEFVLRLFHRLGLQVEPVIMRCQLNEAESDAALNLCQELGIKPTVIELSIADFFLEHFNALQNNNLRVLLGVTPHVIHKFVGGKILTGYGDPSPDSAWADVAMLPEWDFYTDTLGDHPGPFFVYTPELFLAFLRDVNKTVSFYRAKCELYNLPYREKIPYKPYVYEVQKRFKINTKDRFEIKNEELQRLLRSGHSFSL